MDTKADTRHAGNAPFKPTQGLDGAQPLAGSLITNHFAAAGKPNNFGPEDVAVSPLDGHVYTGLGDGSILRIDPDSGAVSVFTNTGGRPLGVTFSASGDRLYVADGHLGLLSVDTSGKVTVLASSADGESVKFADNLDVAPDGRVWFSAPTRDHTFEQVTLDVWDSRPSGRLLRYDPDTGENEMARRDEDHSLAPDGFDRHNPATWGKVSRNALCPCGSGKKYKQCHGRPSS